MMTDEDEWIEGFMARNRDEEWQCPGQQISVLVDFEEVTGKIAAATAGMYEAEANEARKAELTRLESACEEAADGKRRCEADPRARREQPHVLLILWAPRARNWHPHNPYARSTR